MEPKGSQREPKRAKREPKATENALQNRCSEKVVNSMVKRDARASIFGCRFASIFQQKGINKSMQNSMLKKYGQFLENAPKMTPK